MRWNNTPTVEITNKHIGVLMMLSEKWGGKVRDKGDRVFVWSIYGKRAVRFMRDVGKYSVVKFPQIFLLLSAHCAKDKAERNTYITNIRNLKRVYSN